MFDTSNCEVHVLNKVKNHVRQIKVMVGKLYSMANILKQGSVLEEMVDNIQAIVEQEVHRVECSPPTGSQQKWHDLFDILFDLHAPHHLRDSSSRNRIGTSQLVADLRELMAVVNDEPTSDRWVHYCWDPVTKKPCCESLREAREKVVVALINVFVTPAFPVVTMSRFTYVLKALTRVIAGKAVKRILPRCLASRAYKGPMTMKANVEELGAGAMDWESVQGARLNSLGLWLNDPESDWEVPLTFVCTSIVSSFEYRFFPDYNGKEPVKADDLLDRFNGPISECLTSLWSALDVWHFRQNGPWRLMGLIGLASSNEKMRRCARSQLLGLSAGITMHFDNKYCDFPWKLHRLVSTQWSNDERRQVVEELQVLPDCCASVFTRHFKMHFATVDDKLSKKAMLSIQTWLRGKVWQTLTAERGHAAERAALAAASAPGRTWHHHARADVLRQRHELHKGSYGVDASSPAQWETQTGPLQVIDDPWKRPSLMAMDTGQVEHGGMMVFCDVPKNVAVPALEDQRPQGLQALDDRARPVAWQAKDEALAVQPSGRGGNILQTFVNSRMHAKKESVGKRSLTAQEVCEVRTSAKRDFNNMTDEMKSAYSRKYAAQVSRRRHGQDVVPIALPSGVKAYVPHLGCGKRSQPVTSEQFVAKFKHDGGFPKDADVYKPRAGFVVDPGDVLAADALKGCQMEVCCA